MSEFEITRDVSGSKGRYAIARDGVEAELTYSIASPTLVIADHTAVPPSMRGTGAGRALVERLVEDARTEGFKITPLCPFVNAQRIHHPHWADVFSV